MRWVGFMSVLLWYLSAEIWWADKCVFTVCSFFVFISSVCCLINFFGKGQCDGKWNFLLLLWRMYQAKYKAALPFLCMWFLTNWKRSSIWSLRRFLFPFYFVPCRYRCFDSGLLSMTQVVNERQESKYMHVGVFLFTTLFQVTINFAFIFGQSCSLFGWMEQQEVMSKNIIF